MPKPPKGPRLGGSPSHERLILANLATALFRHGKITTTQTKARRLRPYAERLVTKAKRGDLHARRQVHAVIRDKEIVHQLFATIGPNYAGRPGGYTRITKVGSRKGDNAPMAVIELVEPITAEQAAEAAQAKAESKPASAPAAPAEEPKAATEPEAPAEATDDSETPAEGSESRAE